MPIKAFVALALSMFVTNSVLSEEPQPGSTKQPQPGSSKQSQHEQYWQTLQSLCGAEYQGEMTFPTEGQDSLAGKLLVARFATCNESEVRIPFTVGEDKSRTWVISSTDKGLQLKHDHRHADGTPDEVTNYGGTVTAEGGAYSQSFPADAFTAELIPAASTNVWQLSFSDDLSTLTYHLTRHAKPRFTAVLKRVAE